MKHREFLRFKPLSPFFSVPTSYAGDNVYFSGRTYDWNANMRDCLRTGALDQVVQLYSRMGKQGLKPDSSTFPLLLKALAGLSWLKLRTAVHGQILKHGFGEDIVIATALVDIYAKSADLHIARQLFDEMPHRDIVAFNAMLTVYSRNGYVDEVFSLFSATCFSGAKPNSLTLSVLLQVCADVGVRILGRCLHGLVYRHGVELEADVFLCNSLLVFYNKCGDLEDSKCLFNRMTRRDLVSWNVMISGHLLNGFSREALEMFRLLQNEGFSPDLITLETALQACARTEDIIQGKTIHGILVRSGFSLDLCVENSVLLMYCKCGCLQFSYHMFEKMPVRNLVSWNILINGYVQAGRPQQALSMFNQLRLVEAQISSDLLVSALRAIRQLGCLEQGMCIHGLVVVTGLDSDIFVGSSLIATYGECGSIRIARRCFDCINGRNKVIWNSMLSAYVNKGWFDEAIELVHSMQFEGREPDAVTLVNILRVCGQTSHLTLGKIVHGYSIRNQIDSTNIVVAAALLDLYVKCGLLQIAGLLFRKMPARNIVSWNTMIFGCLENGFPTQSLVLFHQMQQEGIIPDATTLVGLVEACSQRGNGTEGRYIHQYAYRAGFHEDEFVANSLISMYSEFGDFDYARYLFDRIPRRTNAIWNAMIANYSRFGLLEQAISVFQLMKFENVVPDSITLLSILPVCARLASLRYGESIHSFVCKEGYEADVFVGTALIDMYSKCGDITMARQIFDQMNVKNAITWNSMIWAYGVHGNAREVHNLFSQMNSSDLNPDAITFLVLISACSHSGDVNRGRQYLDLMVKAYSISPQVEHYSCMVDLLGRGGLLCEAHEFIEKMPLAPTTYTWGSLLNACRIHGNMEIGMVAAKKLFELNPRHYGYRVLLSNMQAEFGRWVDASMTRIKLREMGVNKLAGLSMVEQVGEG